MLTVNNVTKSFSRGDTRVVAVKDISFHVPQGKFASIIGKSGSGKSTLLSILGALDAPTEGEVIVEKNDIARLRGKELVRYRAEKIGFVFQSYNLMPNLSAIENVILPLEFISKIPRTDRRARAAELLEQVGLSAEKHHRRPGRLSGGEQQRVAIARALANKPRIILADEPTGNLDSATGKMIFDLLHRLTREADTTIIAVTHDLGIAGMTDITLHLHDGSLK